LLPCFSRLLNERLRWPLRRMRLLSRSNTTAGPIRFERT
jgi:hypothetical protein